MSLIYFVLPEVTYYYTLRSYLQLLFFLYTINYPSEFNSPVTSILRTSTFLLVKSNYFLLLLGTTYIFLNHKWDELIDGSFFLISFTNSTTVKSLWSIFFRTTKLTRLQKAYKYRARRLLWDQQKKQIQVRKLILSLQTEVWIMPCGFSNHFVLQTVKWGTKPRE